MSVSLGELKVNKAQKHVVEVEALDFVVGWYSEISNEL